MDRAQSLRQTKLKNQLTLTNMKLNQILGCKFEDICLFCKNLGKKFAKFMTQFSTIKQDNQLRKIFDQCLQNVEVLVRSTSQFKEYFQFPYLNYIFKKISMVVQKLKEFSQINVNLRVEKNEQSFYKKNINLRPITKGQFKFLKSKQINQTILEIFNNQIVLPNNCCILCSQVFLKDFQTFDSNPRSQVVLGLTQTEAFNKIQMYKYLCAVCNQGGGVLIVGAQRIKNSICPKGIYLKDQKQYQQKVTQIRDLAASHIRPQFYFDIFCVRVHNNFVDRQNLYQQKDRYCLKIVIQSKQRARTSYIELSNKGFHSLFQSYRLQHDNVISLLPQKTKNSFYNYMHNKYYKKNAIPINSHHVIKCTSPYIYSSKLLANYWNSLTEEQKFMHQYQSNVSNQVVQQSEELKFKYNNNSILAVGSKNKDRFVTDFQDYANTKKLVFQLFKPFKKYFKQGQRSIWMLSHVDKHETIKAILKQVDKEGYITFIPVHKTLQIDRSKISQPYYQHIQKTFLQKYPEGFQVNIKNVTYEGKERQALFFEFNCYPHSIYGYLIFESLQLKPYFVKDNTEYKKKTSKKW